MLQGRRLPFGTERKYLSLMRLSIGQHWMNTTPSQGLCLCSTRSADCRGFVFVQYPLSFLSYILGRLRHRPSTGGWCSGTGVRHSWPRAGLADYLSAQGSVLCAPDQGKPACARNSHSDASSNPQILHRQGLEGKGSLSVGKDESSRSSSPWMLPGVETTAGRRA